MEPNRQGEVWIFAEQEDGSLSDVVLELCGKARELADRLGVKTGAVLARRRRRPYGREPDRPRGRHGLHGRRSAAIALSNVALRPGSIDSDPAAPPANRDLRGNAVGPRPCAARGFRASLGHDRRLHRSGNQRRCGPEDQGGAQKSASANPPGLRREHHRHDREFRPMAADGHGPRGRDGP